MSDDEGWFEIEEEIVQNCDANHPRMSVFHPSGHTVIVKRRIRFTGRPSRAAEAWLAEATRANRADPRRFDMTRF